MQTIIVYILIILAVIGTIRYVYRKLRALRKKRNCSVCASCPLKDNCSKPMQERKKAANSCCKSKGRMLDVKLKKTLSIKLCKWKTAGKILVVFL